MLPSAGSLFRWPQQPTLCQAETRSSLRVSHAGAGAQGLGPSSIAFPGGLAGSGIGRGAPGTRTRAPVGYWRPRPGVGVVTVPHRRPPCFLLNFLKEGLVFRSCDGSSPRVSAARGGHNGGRSSWVQLSHCRHWWGGRQRSEPVASQIKVLFKDWGLGAGGHIGAGREKILLCRALWAGSYLGLELGGGRHEGHQFGRGGTG